MPYTININLYWIWIERKEIGLNKLDLCHTILFIVYLEIGLIFSFLNRVSYFLSFSIASGGWPERSNPSSTRVNQLLDYYKAIALQEKQEKLEKERKKFAIRGKYITLTVSINIRPQINEWDCVCVYTRIIVVFICIFFKPLWYINHSHYCDSLLSIGVSWWMFGKTV